MKERGSGDGPKGGNLTKDWRKMGNKQIQKSGSKGNTGAQDLRQGDAQQVSGTAGRPPSTTSQSLLHMLKANLGHNPGE